MADSLVVHGAVVLTGPVWSPFAADLLVEDGRVVAVEPPGSFDSLDAGRHDAAGRLVLPGLVNAHTHSHTLPARGVARDWTLEVSLLNGGWLAGPRADELAELCALLAATEMIASGGTGAFDLLAQSGGPEPEGLWAAAQGYRRAGLRAVLAPMVADRSVHEAVPQIGECCPAPPPGLTAEEIVARTRAYLAGLDPSTRVTGAVAPTIAAHCSAALVTGLHEVAAEQGLRLHTHLAESKPQAICGAARFGRSITAELAGLGVLDAHATLAHAIWIDDADRALLAEAGATAVTVPGSNLRLGSGVADTRAALDAGITLAIGTDGANSADALDVLDAARLTAVVSRLFERSSWLGVEEVLEAATVGGAAACGWTDVGRVAPGYAADLVFLDLDSRAFRPRNDLANQVLTAARAAEVVDVMVAGDWVLRERRHVGLDLPALLDRFEELTEELHASAERARADAAADAEASAASLSALRRRPWPISRLLRGDDHDG